MLEVLVGDVVAPAPELLDGPLDVDRVPQRYRGAQDVEAAGPVHLVLVGAVAHLAEAVEKDGPCQGVARLALLRPAVTRLLRSGLLIHSR